LHEASKALGEAGISVVAVSYDSMETLKEFSDKQKIGFPLLSDAGSKVIEKFGIRNKDMDERKELAGVPHPGTFVIDKEGVVRAKLFLKRYAQRHSVKELIAAGKAVE
jgi:peroxiredoxin